VVLLTTTALAAVGPASGTVGSTVASSAGPAAVLAGMSEAQRVGQLFMVGGAATGVSSATLSAISSYHVGSIILTGRSSAGVTATARVTAALRARVTSASTAGVPLFVATDQEGGEVQVLSGPGFSTIPSALTQGTWSVSRLDSSARTWASQLRAAGVNLDLAPVTDTVPSATAARSNPPIGQFQREFGYTTATVASHGTAFAQGMAASGVAVSVKHFPGLGRVTANTDTSSGVTDTVTTRHDAYLTPFTAGIHAGAPFVMVSSAYYSLIDPTHPAAFSSTVIKGMLRSDLGFTGVVVSDDLGNAKQVAAWSPGNRAIDFITAGGDMVLTVNPSVLPSMYDAVLARANSSTSFRAQVDAAALKVLIAKAQRNLIGGAVGLSAPVAGQLAVAEREDDGQVTLRIRNGGTWSAARCLGGRIVAGPAVATATNGSPLVAAVGTDSAAWVTGAAIGRPSGWASLGGVTAEAPAVALHGTQAAVGVRGTDGALWLRTRSGSSWSRWARVPSGIIGPPALAFTPSGTLVAAMTGTNGAVYLATRTGTGWSWTTLGGLTGVGPSLSIDAATGALTIAIRDESSGVSTRTRTASSWSGWTSRGGVVTTPPSAAPGASAGVTDVLARGSDARLWLLSGSSWAQLPF
jgi:beta-N-acetylhexosaminidase